MNKQILKSNSAFVVIGDAPAWKTGEEVGRLFPLVQSADFSITNERQKIKEIGSQSYAVDNIVRSPSASIDLSYYLNPYCSNEILAGFNASGSGYAPCLSGLRNRDQNIYILIDPEDSKDAFDDFKRVSSSVNFSGMQALTFGNCFLNKYSASFELNSIPTVEVGFAASNVRFESITGGRISVPAINSVSGNNTNSGSLNLSGLYSSLTSGYVDNDPILRNEFNPRVALSNSSSFALQNLQVGGVGLNAAANPILQRFSLNLDLTRTDLYGLGSNYVYSRKLEMPVNGSVSISCLVSGVSQGEFQSIITNESGYNFEVSFCDQNKIITGFYRIENAKLENINYGMQVNNILSFDASFSFEANETGGFFMKRSSLSPIVWQTLNIPWQDISIGWLNI